MTGSTVLFLEGSTAAASFVPILLVMSDVMVMTGCGAVVPGSSCVVEALWLLLG